MVSFLKISESFKICWKSGFLYLNFTFRIRIPNTDPDPAWQFDSGFNRIRIRNTGYRYGAKKHFLRPRRNLHKKHVTDFCIMSFSNICFSFKIWIEIVFPFPVPYRYTADPLPVSVVRNRIHWSGSVFIFIIKKV